MKTKRQKWFWIVDAALLGGFLGTYYLDRTGVVLHQWLGIAVAALAGYHLAVHWAWVKGVTKRLTCGAGHRALLCWGVDATVLAGLALVTLTGLIISTWLSLPLGEYTTWRTVHVAASLATLAAVVLKVGLHWRWILGTARRMFSPRPDALPGSALPMQPALVRVAEAKAYGRREFLALMGGVGLAALLAGSRALDTIPSVLAEGPAEDAAQPTPTTATTTAAMAAPTTRPTVTPTAVPQTACTVRCPRGCSYPGRCSRYTDRNGNKLCDLGECL